MTDHDDLRDDLETYAHDIDVPPGDVDDVRRRGDRRRVTTRIGGGAGLLAVVAALALVVGPALDRPVPSIDDVADESVPRPPSTPTEPTPTPSPEARATNETPEPDPTAGGPTVLVATDDGIVRWQDGASERLPGLDGPVDIALPGPDDTVWFQRNDQAFGALTDGAVSTVASVDDFQARDFEVFEDVPPVALQLWDGDPVTGRVVFTVRHQGEPRTDGETPPTYDALWELTGDGDLVSLADWWSWEAGAIALSIGGGDTFRSYMGEQGSTSVGGLTPEGWEPLAFLSGEGESWTEQAGRPYQVRSGEADGDGNAIAALRWDTPTDAATLQVVDLVGGETVVRSVDLPGQACCSSAVWAFVDDRVLVGGGDVTLLVDVRDGRVSELDLPAGRATLVPARDGAR